MTLTEKIECFKDFFTHHEISEYDGLIRAKHTLQDSPISKLVTVIEFDFNHGVRKFSERVFRTGISHPVKTVPFTAQELKFLDTHDFMLLRLHTLETGQRIEDWIYDE